jgi:hypothetical protein
LQHFVRYWSNIGHWSALALNGSVANDPSAASHRCHLRRLRYGAVLTSVLAIGP